MGFMNLNLQKSRDSDSGFIEQWDSWTGLVMFAIEGLRRAGRRRIRRQTRVPIAGPKDSSLGGLPGAAEVHIGRCACILGDGVPGRRLCGGASGAGTAVRWTRRDGPTGGGGWGGTPSSNAGRGRLRGGKSTGSDAMAGTNENRLLTGHGAHGGLPFCFALLYTGAGPATPTHLVSGGSGHTALRRVCESRAHSDSPGVLPCAPPSPSLACQTRLHVHVHVVPVFGTNSPYP